MGDSIVLKGETASAGPPGLPAPMETAAAVRFAGCRQGGGRIPGFVGFKASCNLDIATLTIQDYTKFFFPVDTPHAFLLRLILTRSGLRTSITGKSRFLPAAAPGKRAARSPIQLTLSVRAIQYPATFEPAPATQVQLI